MSGNDHRLASRSPLVRLQNALSSNLSRRGEIPKYIVVILEDDIINFLNYNDYGVTEMYGKLIDYLSKEFKATVNNFKTQYLPQKTRRSTWPFYISTFLQQ